MGTNTPNPSTMSLADATQALECALSKLEAVGFLLHLISTSESKCDPIALWPVAEMIDETFARADEAFQVVFPILRAASAVKDAAQ
jgi:hypothetical protein